MTSHKGWYSRGYLPHFDSPNAVQFITFRLADSLPREVLEGIYKSSSGHRERMLKLEGALDRGVGACVLKDQRVAEVVQTALLHFHQQRYEMHGWCIMPNHVHVIVQPSSDYALPTILQNWKSFTAKRINKMLDRSGRLWQPESFDRYIRDERHFQAALVYVEENPLKAGLVEHSRQWPWSSASWRR